MVPGSGCVKVTHVEISVPDSEIAFQGHGTHDHRRQQAEGYHSYRVVGAHPRL